MASATSYASSKVYGAIVEKFCAKSQGQPVSARRSAAMISRRRSMSREGVIAGIPDTVVGAGDRTEAADPIRLEKSLRAIPYATYAGFSLSLRGCASDLCSGCPVRLGRQLRHSEFLAVSGNSRPGVHCF